MTAALNSGARQLVLLAGAQPPSAATAAMEAAAAASGARLTLLLLSPTVLQNPDLLGYALLCKTGSTAAELEGVLIPPLGAEPPVAPAAAAAATATVTAVALANAGMADDAAAGGSGAAATSAAAAAAVDAASVSQEKMRDLVRSALEEVLGLEVAGSIQEGDPLMTAGLNSTAAVALTQRLENSLGVTLPPTLVFDFPSVREVSEYLAEQHAPQHAAVGGGAEGGKVSSVSIRGHPTAGAAAVGPTAAAAPPLSAAGSGRAIASSLVMDTVRDLLGLGLGSDAGTAADAFDPSTPLMVAGLNSTAAVTLTSRLETALGAALPPTLVFDYPTVDDIVEYLVESELLPDTISPGTAAAAAPVAAAPASRPGAKATIPTGVVAASVALSGAADAILVVATAHRVAGGMLEKPLQGEGCEGQPVNYRPSVKCI